jgi:hypothetical protein
MQPPTSLKLMHGFIGMVNYYRDMWPHRLHILAPLTTKSGAKSEKSPPFQWTPEMQKAFDQMKSLMVADRLCAYPDHNKPSHLFTDASDYQFGTCIMQEGKSVACYSKIHNSAQMNYVTIDKELLCVIATLRKFCSMLLGAEQHVCTDHKNILSIGDSSQQCLCWISYVDEYGPGLHYVECPRNVIADTFSRHSCSNASLPLVGKQAANVVSNSESNNRNESSHSLIMDDKDIIDCLMTLPCVPSRKKKERSLRKMQKVL